MVAAMDESVLLTGFVKENITRDTQCIVDEQWKEFTTKSIVKDLLDVILSEKEKDSDLGEVFLNAIKDRISETKECHTDVVLLGVVALKVFLQANWTGPDVVKEDLGCLENIIQSKELNSKALVLLESNGEEVYQLVSYPILLFIANVILVKCLSTLHLFKTLCIWSVKCISTHFAVLSETGDSHYKAFKDVLSFVEDDQEIISNLPDDVQAEFYLDCSHLFLKFYGYKKAEECHKKVKDLLKVEISLTSSLGKRTKFQYKDLPQMLLDIKVGQERVPIKTSGETTKDLPTDVTLDNDTLLPHIRFVDAECMKNTEMSSIEQAYILASCIYLQKTKPRDKLAHEEVLPFVESVLMSPTCWAVQYKSLYMRCVTEFSNARKAERALMQLESLASSVSKSSPKAFQRQLHLHGVDLEPTWSIQRVHAQLLFSIGCTDSALEIFLNLYLWDDVIACYQRLGKHGKAEEVIREQLAKRESATLWCLLGDATLDKQYYEKAWQVSKHRSARAQRSLGLFHLRKQEFADAIPYFQKSLELNCLQPGIAFSLGCSCMAENKIELAARALQQCVSLEPDNHEAWNNLASSFIKLGQLDKAYKALKESCRLSYDNWRIWENFLLVCTDIGAFDDVINCCNRLVDLGRKNIDTEVLHILVQVVLTDEEDFRGIRTGRLKPKLFKLFGHITSQITSIPSVWEEYATLCLSNDNPNDNEKALQYLYKSHRCYTQHTDWEKSEALLPQVQRVTNEMMTVTKKVCNQTGYEARAISFYSTTKMAISNLIIRLKKAYSTNVNEIIASVQPIIEDLENHVVELQSLINSVT